MATVSVATRLPEDVAEHVEDVAESPVTDYESKSAVVRDIVVSQLD